MDGGNVYDLNLGSQNIREHSVDLITREGYTVYLASIPWILGYSISERCGLIFHFIDKPLCKPIGVAA